MDAQSTQAYIPGISDALLTVGALVLVVVIILLLGWIAKRFSLTSGSHAQIPMKYVGQISVGNKEKVSVVDVGNERLVLGVTANQITLLSKQPQLQFQSPQLQKNIAQKPNVLTNDPKDKTYRKQRQTPVFSEILEDAKEEGDDDKF